MPAKDDGIHYWVPTEALVSANNCEAPTHVYWLAFRDAADELYRAYSDSIELPDGIESTWSTPRSELVKDRYQLVCTSHESSSTGVFRVIRKYQQMKCLRRYACAPLELLTAGDGQSRNCADTHVVEINGVAWHYAKLDGNHRLMAAYYAEIERVPVLLKTWNPGPTAETASSTQDG